MNEYNQLQLRAAKNDFKIPKPFIRKAIFIVIGVLISFGVMVIAAYATVGRGSVPEIPMYPGATVVDTLPNQRAPDPETVSHIIMKVNAVNIKVDADNIKIQSTYEKLLKDARWGDRRICWSGIPGAQTWTQVTDWPGDTRWVVLVDYATHGYIDVTLWKRTDVPPGTCGEM